MLAAAALAGGAGIAAAALLTLGGSGTGDRKALPVFLGAAIGAPRADAPAVRRPAPGVAVTLKTAGGYTLTAPALRAASLPAAQRTARVTLESTTATGAAGTPWAAHAAGATRATAFGHETVVVTGRKVEQFLTVSRRAGTKTWEWKLDSSLGWPRVGDDGYVAFIDAKRQIRQDLLIAPVQILDAKGRRVTPKGLRWQVAKDGKGSWFLQLPLNDAKLPLPYVIDPATLRGTQTSGGGSAVASFTIPMPSGLVTNDLLVSSAFFKNNGNNVTAVTTTGGSNTWVADKNFTSGTPNNRLTISSKRAGASDVTGGGSYTITATFSSGTTGDGSGIVSAFQGWYTKDVVGNATTSWAVNATTRTISAVGTSCLGTSGGVDCTFTPSGAIGTDLQYSVFNADSENFLVYRNGTTYTVKARGVNGTTAAAHSNGATLSVRTALGQPSITTTVNNDVVIATWANDTKATSGNQFGLSAAAIGIEAGATAAITGGATGGTTAIDVAFFTQATAGATSVLYQTAGTGMTAGGSPASTQVSYAPDVSTSTPVVSAPTSATRNSGTYSSSWSGTTAADPALSGSVAGSGLSSVAIRLRRSGDNFYWNGSAWAAPNTTFAASGTSNWTATGPSVGDLTSGTTYTVSAVAADVAGNTAESAGTSFLYDADAPTSTVAFPVTSTRYNAAGYSTSWSGTAADTGGSGVASVALRIQRSVDGNFWNGTTWVSGSTTIAATFNAGNWTATGPAGASLADGTTYTVTPVATDAAGTSQDGTAATFVYDTSAPTVSGVSATTADGTFVAGGQIDVTVAFSEAVTVTGTPQLTLETGSVDRVVNYTSGSGTSTLTFRYTVQSGDVSSDLDYTSSSALALNSGSIKDAAGNNATLTLASPGASGSLANAKALVVDAVAPTVTGVSSSTSDGAYRASQTVAVTVTFSENVTVTGTPQLTLETGSVDRVVNYGSGSGGTTLTFTYTVQSGDTSSDLDYTGTGSLALNGGTIKDAAGNDATLTLASPGAPGSLANAKAIVIDTTAPTVTGVSSALADGTYKLLDALSATVTFSEAVTVTGVPKLTLETGAVDNVASYASGSPGSTLTFTTAVAAGDVSADLDYAGTGALALNGGTITDAAGNSAVLTLASPGASGSLANAKAIVVDGVRPAVTGVGSSTANGTYKAGDTVTVTVTFDDTVTVTGTPKITLETGTTDRDATYVSGSGGSTLSFTYTVQSGDTSGDLDYASTGALTATGGSIRDASGNDADLTLATPGAAGSLANAKAIVIDAVAPTVTGVSSPATNGSFKLGQTIDVTVAFSESVTVTGFPQLTLETGAVDRTVTYSSGSGTSTLIFTYTVQSGDTSSDLDYTGPTALSLNGGSIKDAAGNDAVRTLATPGQSGSLAFGKALAVDGVIPTVTGVTSGETNGRFKTGRTIDITVTFSEAVTVTGTPQLTLETGTIDRNAAYISGSPGTTLTFRYTVQTGDTSGDLDYKATDSLAVGAGAIKDAAGNDADLTLASPGASGSLANGKALVVDGVVPTVLSVGSDATNGTFKIGDTINVSVTFSEAVTVTGTPRLTLETGSSDRAVNYVSGTGTDTLLFVYTVQSGDTSTDLDTVDTSSLALAAGTIADAAGNDADLTLPTPGGSGSLSLAKAIVVDGVAPTVTGVSSATANGTYKTGDTIGVTVTFSEAVIVTGSPHVTLETGSTDRDAVYVSGSNSTTLTFAYTVVAGDQSSDLDVHGTGAYDLNGGALRDAAGNNADVTLPAPGATGSLGANKAIVVDAVAPTVTGVSSTAANGTYRAGQSIDVTVTFSEPVSVGNTPRLTLETGSVDRPVNYASGDGTATLTFTYTVQAGDTSSDLDYTTSSALTLNGGTITDLAGNTADRTLPNPGTSGSLAFGKAIVIDGIAPTLSSVTSATTNGTYKAGDQIDVSVTFGEAVVVGGTPRITLETGTTDRTANYTSGSGSTTLRFTYTVVAGDSTVLLDYVDASALDLNGGSITDAAGNDAVTTMPAPGAAGSLGANKSIVVDAVAPTVTNVSSTTPNATYQTGDVIDISITFTEAVAVTGSPTVAVDDGAAGATATYAGGTGTSTLHFNYTVGASDNNSDLDLVDTTALALNGGTIKDVAGNSAVLTVPAPGGAGSLSANKDIVVQASSTATVTSVTSAQANGTFKAGDAITVQVAFTIPVTVTGTPRILLETGATDRYATFSSGSGTTTLSFAYTVQAGDTSSDLDYTSNSALGLNGGTIKSGGNDATLTLPVPGAAGSLGANRTLVVDGVAPTVTGVSSTTGNGAYKAGDAITVTVAFGETVVVTGSPRVQLSAGATPRYATYSTGTGTATLSFTYTVQAGDTSADLDYASTSALGLNSGTIKDAAGNAATLTLASPGASGSLAFGKALVIDTTAPDAPVAQAQVPANGIGLDGSTAVVASDATFELASGGTDTNAVTISYAACPGSCANYAAAVLSAVGVIGSSSSLLSAYPVAWSPLPADGSYTVFARATDVAGNTADSAALPVLLDTAAPSVGTPAIASVPAAVNAFQSGSTIYFRSSASGSFSLQQSFDDGTGSGPQKVAFPALATSGWTHGAEQNAGCSGSPCTLTSSSSFTWTGGASTPTAYSTVGYDNAGNGASSSSVTFTSDTTAPSTPTVATPGTGGSGAIVNGSTVKLTAAPTDGGAGVKDVTYKACAGASCTYASATITLGTSTDAAGKFPVTWPAGRADGTYTIVARASDNVGNTSDSTGMTVTLDNTAPSISTVRVVNVTPQQNGQDTAVLSGASIVYKGALGSGSGSFQVEVTGSDAGSGLQQAQFPALGGTPGSWTHTAQNVTSAGPTYTASNAYAWPAGETAAPTLTVTLKDVAGNTASSTFTLTNDSAAPTTTWTPANRAALASWQGGDAAVQLTASDSGAAGVAAIYRDVDATATTSSPTGGSFSISAEGSHTISFLAVDAVGNAETVQSPVDLIRIDKTVPVNAVTLAGSPAGAVLSGSTVYFRATGGGSGGSFGLVNAVTDGGSGPASTTFGAIAGTATGWTSPSGHTVTGTSPYSSQTYTWAEGATSSGATIAVQSADAAGNVSTTATITLADDSTGPTGGTVSYAGGIATSTTPSVAYTLGSDAGAGVASAVLQRASATLSGTTCGSFGSFSTVASGLVASGTFSDSGLVAGACYAWRLIVSDRLGNATTFTSASEYKLDSTSPLRAVGDGPAGGHLLDNAGTLWVSPAGGTFQLKLSDAAQAGVTQVAYPAVSVGGITPTLSGAAATPSVAPFTSATYTWTSGFTGPSTISAAITAGGSPASEPIVVRRDATAPATGDNAPASAQSSAVTVSLTPSDGESGVAATYFTTNGADPTFNAATGAPTGATQQGTSVSLATSGTHVVKFLSRDNVGNVEAVKTKTVLVDLADDRPVNAVGVTPGSVSPAGAAAASSGIIWVNAAAGGSLQLRNHVTDGVSGPASSSTGAVSGASTAGWSHTGGAMTSAGGGDFDSGTVTWSLGAASPVTIAVSSTDNVGNTSTTTSVTLQTDATAPNLTLTPPTSPRSTAGAILVSASDAGSGIRGTYYTTDGSTPGAAADGTPTGTSQLVSGGSITVPAVQGTLTVKAVAIDNVGNQSAVATASVVVDTTAPATPVLAAIASPSHTGATLQLTGTVADTGGAGGVSIAYYFCSGASAACGSPTLIGSISGSSPYAVTWSTQPADGTYTVFARATDAAGNTADSTGTTIAVDNNAPIMSIASGPSSPTNSTSATFDFTASETVTYECNLDSGGFAACTDPVTFTVASGAHTLVVRARDSANNVSGSVTYPTWTVDTVAPSGSFAPSAPPAGSTWSLTATATDAGGTGMQDVTFQYAPSVSGVPGTWTTIGSAAAAPGPYTASWATGPSNGIPNGDYFLRAVARDVAGNSASLAAPAAVTVANTPKALLTASVGSSGTQLALQYNGQIDTGSVPTNGSFTVHVGAATIAVTGVTFGFDTVYLALATAVVSGDTVSLDYAPAPLSPALKDVLGFNLANLAGQGVGNNSTVGTMPPKLAAATPADGSTLAPTGLATGTITFTADKSVTWTGVQLEVPAGAPAAPVFTAPAGTTATATYGSTVPGLYTFRATLNDGVNAPVNVASHFTIPQPGAADAPTTSKSADPAVGSTLPSSDGGARLEWDPGTFADPTTISVDPVISSAAPATAQPPVVFGLSTSITSSAVEVSARRLSDGASVTSFPPSAPLEVVFANATAEDVPIRSSDGGVTYQDIPRISPPSLPAGYVDGYWWDSGTGTLHILTTHLTVFALVRDSSPPSAPRSLSGVIAGDGVTLRWEPASDNSGRIAHYHLFVNGERVQTFGGETYEAKLGPYTPGDTRVFQVRADDSRGNVGQPANAVTLLPAIAGQTPAAARLTLVRSGLSIGSTTTVGSTQPQGTIVSTSPAYPAVVTVGGTIDVAVSDGSGFSAGASLVLKVASAKHVALRQRKSVALRVLVSVAAKATITMRDSKGATVASWKKTLRAGATIVNVKIPATAMRTGTFRFTVSAEPQQASSAKPTLRTTIVRFGQLPAPIGKRYDVVLVNGPATRQAASLAVPGAATVRTVTTAPDVYDVAASAKTNVQAVVVDLDTKGVDAFHFVRNLRAVYPDLRIVALASTPAQVDQARQFGATVVLTKPLSVEVLASVLKDLLPVATSATRATAAARPANGLTAGAQSVAAKKSAQAKGAQAKTAQKKTAATAAAPAKKPARSTAR